MEWCNVTRFATLVPDSGSTHATMKSSANDTGAAGAHGTDTPSQLEGPGLRSAVARLALVALSLSPSIPAALAEQDRPSALADGLFRVESNTPREVAARQYQTADGRIRFTLDRTGNSTLLQFEDTEEVLALNSVIGPRNDEILRTDTGMSIVRITSNGGLVFYRSSSDAGLPATLEAARPALAAPAPPPGGLQRGLDSLVGDYAAATNRPLRVSIGQSAPSAQPLMWDAAKRAVSALEVARPERASMVTNVSVVVGSPPNVALRGPELVVTVTPTLGWAGRPSSIFIRRVVETGAR
jgi:hypothetical protein